MDVPTVERGERAGLLCRMATAVTGDVDRAHEAVQDGFARALGAIGSFRDEGPLEAWVWRIILRSAIDGRPSGAPITDVAEAVVRLPFPERDPDLAAALESLTPRRRLIVFLRYWCDLSVAEIAAIVGAAEGTVSATLVQSREALRVALAEREEGRE